jgi:hypothetical protein
MSEAAKSFCVRGGLRLRRSNPHIPGQRQLPPSQRDTSRVSICPVFLKGRDRPSPDVSRAVSSYKSQSTSLFHRNGTDLLLIFLFLFFLSMKKNIIQKNNIEE